MSLWASWPNVLICLNKVPCLCILKECKTSRLIVEEIKVGFSTIQKCVCAIRQLVYGYNSDSLDEYLQIDEETTRCYLDYYCKYVFEFYKDEYLRRPISEDIQRLYARHEELHGFPGMLGSIDCMQWPWKNCPKAWQDQFTRGNHGHPTIMLEAVASYNRWIWHAFFSIAGLNNNINVLNQLPLFREIIEDRAPDSSFTVNGTHYKKVTISPMAFFPNGRLL
uniref:uncharacterized protein LOC122608896 n=1 Tax=Erigeron canadensis TaxID=72917 RepID=UPI001CB89A22|nr:uncharacterized protein LOC122608896 [Erigeron canadensis]